MTQATYDLMNNRPDVHWFCVECEKQALTAVKCDWEIEERCAQYMETLNLRFSKVEDALNLKADKAALDTVSTDVLALNTHVSGLSLDITKLSQKIDLLHKEPEDIERRKNNIVMRGLPEDTEFNDEQLVNEVLESIHVLDKPSHVTRLGKKREDNKGRPVKVVLPSEKAKWSAVVLGYVLL
jgi:hypothetical protein